MSRFIESTPGIEANHMTPMKFAAVIVAIVLASGGLDLSQVVFAIAGACIYALVYNLQSNSNAAKHGAARSKRGKGERRAGRAASAGREREPFQLGESAPRKLNPHAQHHRAGPIMAFNPPKLRQISDKPVSPPTFTAIGFNNEVEELTGRLLPSAEGNKILQTVVGRIKDIVLQMVPEAEVVGLTCSDPFRGGAFAVAVPEVEIVISVNPVILATRLKPNVRGPEGTASDDWKLNKVALRIFTSQLVSEGGFKFRRSGFRTQEPKVTLLSPTAPGDLHESIAMDLSVNSVSPLWHAALLAECARIEPRSRALILLVRRWAKDRAMCHISKGNLSPPAWSLLVVYFLQVGVASEGALLPSLEQFEMASQIIRADAQASGHVLEPPRAQWARPRADGPKKSIADLFREFFVFFHEAFDWRGEAVSIRSATRTAPGLGLPLHVLLHENGESELGPSIEDPFDGARNLGDNITSSSFIRLRQEIARAAAMCGSGESLTELLVPWVPPDEADVEEEQMVLQPDRQSEQLLVQEADSYPHDASGVTSGFSFQ